LFAQDTPALKFVFSSFDLLLLSSFVWFVAGEAYLCSGATGLKSSIFCGLNHSPMMIFRMRTPAVR
jgi:hypothetical protein